MNLPHNKQTSAPLPHIYTLLPKLPPVVPAISSKSSGMNDQESSPHSTHSVPSPLDHNITTIIASMLKTTPNGESLNWLNLLFRIAVSSLLDLGRVIDVDTITLCNKFQLPLTGTNDTMNIATIGRHAETQTKDSYSSPSSSDHLQKQQQQQQQQQQQPSQSQPHAQAQSSPTSQSDQLPPPLSPQYHSYGNISILSAINRFLADMPSIPFVGATRLTHLDIGDIIPLIHMVKVQSFTGLRNPVVFDVELSLTTTSVVEVNTTIEIGTDSTVFADMPIQVALGNIFIHGTFRIAIDHCLFSDDSSSHDGVHADHHEHITDAVFNNTPSISVCLVEPPSIHFDIASCFGHHVQLINIPHIHSIIHKLMLNACNHFVGANPIVVDLPIDSLQQLRQEAMRWTVGIKSPSPATTMQPTSQPSHADTSTTSSKATSAKPVTSHDIGQEPSSLQPSSSSSSVAPAIRSSQTPSIDQTGQRPFTQHQHHSPFLSNNPQYPPMARPSSSSSSTSRLSSAPEITYSTPSYDQRMPLSQQQQVIGTTVFEHLASANMDTRPSVRSQVGIPIQSQHSDGTWQKSSLSPSSNEMIDEKYNAREQPPIGMATLFNQLDDYSPITRPLDDNVRRRTHVNVMRD